jgi:CRISPR/Cas system-associated protein Cas10 (large subunit of type III CRISPR-Cas system)
MPRDRTGQKSVQIFRFAAKLNRQFAHRVTENPKVTLSAAVVAFSRLDPQVQLELIGRAREMHLQDTAPAE